MSNSLIDARKENALLKEQVEKASKDLAGLREELNEYEAKTAYLTGKLKTTLSGLATAKASLDRIDKGSKNDDILSSQVLDPTKHRIGYLQGTSTSKSTGKFVFVQGPTGLFVAPTIHNAPTMKYVEAKYKHVPHNKFIPTRHFCRIKGHIIPHRNILRNHMRSQPRKRHYSTQPVKTKSVWVHQFDLFCNVVLNAVTKPIEPAKFNSTRKSLGIGLHP